MGRLEEGKRKGTRFESESLWENPPNLTAHRQKKLHKDLSKLSNHPSNFYDTAKNK